MWTKICGTTNLDDALLAAELGADAIGFIFAASKRCVSPESVAAIAPHLPSGVERVGVFDRADLPFLVDTVRMAGLTAVQLHFALDPILLGELQAAFEGRVRLIQVIGVPADPAASPEARSGLVDSLRDALLRPELFAVLLDTVHEGRSGGTGKAFAWRPTAALLEEARLQAGNPNAEGSLQPHIIVAGGLCAENVAAAVSVFKPWGVDAVSGVESCAGVKDPERLRRFLQTTRTL